MSCSCTGLVTCSNAVGVDSAGATGQCCLALCLPHMHKLGCSKFVGATAGADPERVKREVEEVVGLDCSRAILASAKQGIGIDEILEEVVRRIPPPPDRTAEPLRALIFDSYYDPYKASVAACLCRLWVVRRPGLNRLCNSNPKVCCVWWLCVVVSWRL